MKFTPQNLISSQTIPCENLSKTTIDRLFLRSTWVLSGYTCRMRRGMEGVLAWVLLSKGIARIGKPGKERAVEECFLPELIEAAVQVH
jgi:hypothetical protein